MKYKNYICRLCY